MVVAYTPQSRYAGEISAENWYEILSRPDVRVGFSNPMLDAAGYRTLMLTLLASDHYHNSTIFPTIIGSHFNPPLPVTSANGIQSVELPEIMKPSDSRVVIRDGSIYVLSLLESVGIDYAFEYRSVAGGHDLQMIDLPPEIDLSSPEHAEEYAGARVILGFQRFGSVGRDRTGLPIVYAITVPESAPHPALAREFSAMVISMAGKGGKGWPAPL
jgi:molybdate/tungstate transport system substrate-binding protein